MKQTAIWYTSLWGWGSDFSIFVLYTCILLNTHASNLFIEYPSVTKSADSLLCHIAADSTQPYNAFLSLTTQDPFFCTYVLYVGSICISTGVRNLLSLIKTTWSPTSGITLLRNAPGKSTTAMAFFWDAIADNINRLLVDNVGELPLSYISCWYIWQYKSECWHYCQHDQYRL